jgi:ADP-ribose pyrophosphatase
VAHAGEQFDREVVRHQGAVAIIALDADDHVILIEQYRASIGRREFEIPAGTCDVAGEAARRTAARELREEVGYEASSFELLGSFLNAPGYSDQRTLVYLATSLTKVDRAPEGPEETNATVHRIPFVEAIAMVDAGSIDEAGTVYGLLQVARRRATS